MIREVPMLLARLLPWTVFSPVGTTSSCPVYEHVAYLLSIRRNEKTNDFVMKALIRAQHAGIDSSTCLARALS